MKLTNEDIQELRFTVVQGSNPGSVIRFEPGSRTVRIGRAVDNDIVIGDSTVSRQHAFVEFHDGNFLIADAGSSSGVEKMGFRVGTTPEPLASGDEVRLGDTILRFDVVAKKGALKRAAAREKATDQPAKSEPGRSPLETFQKALSRVGLETPPMQIAAVGLIVLMGILGLLPEAPGLPPQARGSMPIDYERVVGFTQGDLHHLDGAVFEVPDTAEGMAIEFQMFSHGGVDIVTGQEKIESIPPAARWQSFQLLAIPAAIADQGRSLVAFDHLGWKPQDGDIDPREAPQWGVRQMWVRSVSDLSSSPARVADEVLAMRELAGHLDDALGNRYRLVTGLQRATLSTMKVAGRSAAVVPREDPEDRSGVSLSDNLGAAASQIEGGDTRKGLRYLREGLRQASTELELTFRQQLNALALARKKQMDREEILALATLTKQLPDPTDPRARFIRAEAEKLPGKKRLAYEETVRYLSVGE